MGRKKSITPLIPILELYRGEQSAARPSRYSQYPLNGRPGGPLSQPRYLREDKKCLSLSRIELLFPVFPSRSLLFTPSMLPLPPPPKKSYSIYDTFIINFYHLYRKREMSVVTRNNYLFKAYSLRDATNRFNIQQLYALPTLYLCVLYLSENKQRLVPLTA